MRIVVLSDTHRDARSLLELVRMQKGVTDLFLHLGDGESEIQDLLALEPGLPLRCVRGNCDVMTRAPDEDVVEAEEIRIFMAHGQQYHVKHTLKELKAQARRLNASVALYGHTHCQYYAYSHGLHVMNPGSLSFPRGSDAGYGIIEIHGSQILCSLVRRP